MEDPCGVDWRERERERERKTEASFFLMSFFTLFSSRHHSLSNFSSTGREEEKVSQSAQRNFAASHFYLLPKGDPSSLPRLEVSPAPPQFQIPLLEAPRHATHTHTPRCQAEEEEEEGGGSPAVKTARRLTWCCCPSWPTALSLSHSHAATKQQKIPSNTGEVEEERACPSP